MKNQKDMFGYIVEFKQICLSSNEERFGEGTYDYSWSASYDNQIKNVRKIGPTQFPDIVSMFDIEPGTTVYVVWAEWSSGDSFGFAFHNRTEAVGIFTEHGSAEALQQYLINQTGPKNYKKTGEVSYSITTPDGQHFESLFAPWCGYFERLDEVHVTPLILYPAPLVAI